MGHALSPDLLRKMHAYWRAANYLSVGQIYVLDNPPILRARAAYAKLSIHDRLIDHKEYIAKHGDDVAAIRDWKWNGALTSARVPGE